MTELNYPKQWIDKAKELYPMSSSEPLLIDSTILGEISQLSYLRGLSECRVLIEALEGLVHLHLCEQEGLLSGRPTPEMWMAAVNKASDTLASFPPLTQKENQEL